MFCFHKGVKEIGHRVKHSMHDILRFGFTLTLRLPIRERRNPFYKGDDIGHNQ
jgi:hypothetical protein